MAATPVLKPRAGVTRTLTADTLRQLAELLRAFHARRGELAGDIARFEHLLDEMFSVFVSQNRELEPVTGEEVECFDPEDNLDTGNAMAPPFPPFVEAFRAATEELDGYRRYYGPLPIAGLADAVKDFLVASGLVARADTEGLDVCVGAGTVHLYDVVCRWILRRPGDVVLIPEVTYGFFVPQAERSGGNVRMLRVGPDAKHGPDDLAAAIDALNAELLAGWLPTCDLRLAVYAADLGRAAAGAVAPPAASELERLKRELAELGSPHAVDERVETFVRDVLLGGDEEACERLLRRPQLAPPGPPRVAGFLHINPNVFGAVYDADDVAALAPVLQARRVAVVEDIAYHSIRSELGDLGSFLRHECETYCLLGLSKPFAIANCRVGLLIGDAGVLRRLVRIVENSVGYVPTAVQKGVRAIFETPPEVLTRYFEDANARGEGYELKRNVMVACLEGAGSPRLSPDDRARCAELLRRETARFFAWKREQGIELVEGRGRAGDYQAAVSERFVAEGLSRWLELVHDPEAGFFAVVDCGPLLERSPLAGVPIESSFDVFAVLAYLFGVRTIPEEAMGVDDGRRPTRLRLSFSTTVETLVRLLFTAYLGLEQLDAGLVSIQAGAPR